MSERDDYQARYFRFVQQHSAEGLAGFVERRQARRPTMRERIAALLGQQPALPRFAPRRLRVRPDDGLSTAWETATRELSSEPPSAA